MLILKYSVCALMSYVIGCINPSYIIARIKGFDIRKSGSGNAGASNAVITMGKVIGIFSALFDIFKTCLAIFLTKRFFDLPYDGFAVAAVFCSLGHIFPVFMKFKGGKGLACLGGTILMYSWKAFLVGFICAIVLVLITDYICTVSIAAPVIFTVYYTIITSDIFGGLLFAVMSTVMFIRHIENLRHIKQNTEMRLSYLWNPEEERNRIIDNSKENDNN